MAIMNPNDPGLSNWQKFGIGTAAAGMIGSPLYGALFGNDRKNPADAAMPYLDKIPGTVSPYYNPYIQAGQGAMPKLQGQFDQLLNDPGALMNRFGSGYQQSPGYEFQKDQALKAIQNAMAAGGMTGTPEHGFEAGQMASNLANQDYYNYLNHVLGMYGQGLQGEQGINQMGYGASDMLAQILGSNLAQQGGLAYQGVAGENAAKSQDQSNLFGGLGALASLAFL